MFALKTLKNLKDTCLPAGHRLLLYWISLIYSVFWFITPWYRNTLSGWLWFALFYATFLLSYVQVWRCEGRKQIAWLGIMFLLGYLYYPFCKSAAGEFVYPVVISIFFRRKVKASTAFIRFLVIAAAQSAGVLLETWLVHYNFAIAENIIFFIVAIGLSNFAYSRHMVATDQLQRANDEIEHLAQIAERERIARDLHDLLGHTLTVIVLKSDLANRLFTTQPELAHREIAEVETTARKALAEVRQAVAGYRGDGLPAEITSARRALTTAGVQLTTNIDYVSFSPTQANTLCLVLREAVTNVIRHAGATTCRLDLYRDGDSLIMQIEDNGSGELGTEGNGLRGMRERITAVGGTLQRQRSTGGGTELTASLPLNLPPTPSGQPSTDKQLSPLFPAIDTEPGLP
jgi:two-component system sensor histidine kinase DesK